jgi:hypothetical protein
MAGGKLVCAVGTLGVASLLLGCAGSSNTLAPGNEGAPGIKRMLVCSPNTVIALPAEMTGLADPLREQIDAYLRFHDRDGQWLGLHESRRLWEQAMTAARASGAIEKAPVFFAEEADKLYDFDAIVMPSLLVHHARAMDGYARWDGVERLMQVKNAPQRPSGRAQSTLADGIKAGGVRGEVMVTSIHVLVFSRSGERVLEGRGGFGFVHDIDLSRINETKRFQYQLRDLAGDIDAMREGIAVAFDPYLPQPEE